MVINLMKLETYGWNETNQKYLQDFEGKELIPARVLVEHRGHFRLMTEDGEITGIIAGKLYYDMSKEALPAVGDWVLVAPIKGEDKGVIHHILPRKSQFVRKIAGKTTEGQVVAANFDYVFIMTALNNNFNINRLERYLTVAWDSGAEPIIVLSKADLCQDVEEKVEEVEAVALGVKVYAISSLEGVGVEDIEQYCMDGKTAVVLGSSGVGKSTMINTLCKEEILKVNAAREDDDRGRHTTTHRQLVFMQNGGMIIDTPGMRELGLWHNDDDEHGVQDVFSEIEGLAAQCRFRDCTHSGEPGCAVLRAIEDGELSADRLDSFHKLEKELAFIERKKNDRLRLEEKRRIKNLCKKSKNSK